MHHLYVTEGIVLGKRGVGESNALVVVLTRDHGLVRTHGQSARAERSKLRYGLEPLTRGRFTFVKGRYEWRLTGVENVSRVLIAGAPSRRRASGRVARLLLRLIHGEEIALPLFATVEEGLQSLARTEDESIAESIETVLVLRILSQLGYLPHSSELKPFVETDFFSLELTSEAKKSRALLIRAINESLQATGL